MILLEGARRRARKGLPLRALEKVESEPRKTKSTLRLVGKHLPRVYDRVLGSGVRDLC